MSAAVGDSRPRPPATDKDNPSQQPAEGDGVCAVFVIAFLLIGLNTFFWGRLCREMEFYSGQLPGKCLDGRLLGEPVGAATGIGVDDTEGDGQKHSIKMRCVFRVAYYPCSGAGDGDADHGGSCDIVADQPLFTDRASWPLRAAGDAGITCSTHTCGDADWDCSDIGRCDGYEKAVRLCASKLRQQPYPCYMAPGSFDAGVRDEAASFPAGWLVCSILVALVSLTCCYFMLVAIKDEEDILGQLLTSSCLAILCLVGLAVGYIYTLRLISSPKQRGTWETTMQQLAETNSNSNLNATYAVAFVVAEEPGWAKDLIVLGSIAGFCCMFFCCSMCVAVLKIKGEEARETTGRSSLISSPSPSSDSDPLDH